MYDRLLKDITNYQQREDSSPPVDELKYVNYAVAVSRPLSQQRLEKIMRTILKSTEFEVHLVFPLL